MRLYSDPDPDPDPKPSRCKALEGTNRISQSQALTPAPLVTFVAAPEDPKPNPDVNTCPKRYSTLSKYTYPMPNSDLLLIE